jgi:HK97 family phage portal protein
MERPPSSGRYAALGLGRVETRSLNPQNITPNDTVPPASDPGTVGVIDTVIPGDPNGVELIDEGPGGPWPPSIIRPSPWSGWPAEWATPNWWGRLQTLTDTAWTCLDLNSSLLATMPPYLVGASPSLPDDWLDNPDPDKYGSWEEFAKQLFWDYQLGEAFVLATARYSNGWPARFHVVEPWFVNVEMVGGQRVYSIGSADVTADMLHIRYQGAANDAHGHGPLEAGRARLIAATVLTQYGTNLATTGGIPNAVLKHPDELTAAQATKLQNDWITARLSTLGLPAVLSGGITFETLQLSPKDMAMIELLQFNESRLAVLLRVPPFLVGLPTGGDSMTYSNVTSLFDYHWRAGLRPKAQAVMAALSSWLTPRGTRIEVNRDAYVQPEPLVRAQTWEILIRIGVLTAEQVQAIERYGAGSADGVDEHLTGALL